MLSYDGSYGIDPSSKMFIIQEDSIGINRRGYSGCGGLKTNKDKLAG
jgi:hypothetical protein